MRTLGDRRGTQLAQWIMTKFEGVRYREHATRRHGRNADRYIVIRYRVNGRRIDEAIGGQAKALALIVRLRY